MASYRALLPHPRAGEHSVTHDMPVSLVRPVMADKRFVAAAQATETVVPAR